MSIPELQIPEEVYEHASRKDLVGLLRSMSELQALMQQELEQAKKIRTDLEERLLVVAGQLILVTAKVFGKSSEKLPPDPEKKKPRKPPKKRGKVTRQPSERYPNAPIIEKEVKFAEAPACRCCAAAMVPSGLADVVEYLHTIPKQFFVIREKREKYRCKACHGDIQTAPPIPRIKPGSAYSDEMTIDAALSKYCDLIPMERYSAMAARQGFEGLPPNSLIEASHGLAEFVSGAVDEVRDEILKEDILRADETPHKMLEGDPRTNWYLWGFSGETACYFEYHDTRSGDVASAILKSAKCSVLLTDVYSGYGKAIRLANIERKKNGLLEIADANCNAHARRKFNDAKQYGKEKRFYIEKYREIYILEAEAKAKAKAIAGRSLGNPKKNGTHIRRDAAPGRRRSARGIE